MAEFAINECTIIVSGVETKEDALSRIEEMLGAYEDMNDTDASIVIANPDWQGNAIEKFSE